VEGVGGGEAGGGVGFPGSTISVIEMTSTGGTAIKRMSEEKWVKLIRARGKIGRGRW